MKSKGARSDYITERNIELLHRFRQATIASDGDINLTRIVEEIINSPASRFYISEERAAAVMSAALRDRDIPGHSKSKKELYGELIARYRAIQETEPGITTKDAAAMIVRQPAPKFYLTVGSAKVILHKAKKLEWMKKRKKLLRHIIM